jgi:hypothetical protein
MALKKDPKASVAEVKDDANSSVDHTMSTGSIEPSTKTGPTEPAINMGTQPAIDSTIEACLADIDSASSVRTQSTKDLTKGEITQVLHRIAKVKDIDFKTAAQSVAALMRKGAANAGAPDSMQVEVTCIGSTNITEVTRYDIAMAMNSVVNHKNVRKLAEGMAPEVISANLKLVKINPLLDLKGDLANRINRKLSLRKENSLTREEEICCSTYAQWMPNLNELANSTRLRGLLEEDLNARRKKKSQKNTDTGKPKNSSDKKGKAKK